MCEWSECEVTSWEGWQNNEVVRSERRERNEVAIWEGETVVSREGGMKFKDEIVLYCSKEAKCVQGFTTGI